MSETSSVAFAKNEKSERERKRTNFFMARNGVNRLISPAET
jgi:hypothetical protein